MIGLNDLEFKRGGFLCSPDKSSTSFCSDAFYHFCICPTAEEIDERVHIQARAVGKEEMHGIDLNERARPRCFRSWGRIVRSFPWTPFLEETGAREHSLH